MYDKFSLPQKLEHNAERKEEEEEEQANKLQDNIKLKLALELDLDLDLDDHNEKRATTTGAALGVCDIIGEWGLYQWSVTMFALISAALLGLTVMVGPIWTPDMNHVCLLEAGENEQVLSSPDSVGQLVKFSKKSITFQQCVVTNQSHECNSFIYDDENYGKLLTNSFDLVCGRKWLRSFLSSSALTGLLLSSVTLGLVSDRYGRLVCIKTGFVISILATVAAILVSDYFLLNVCFMLMAYAQVGIANALSTIVMESTTPKWRFVPTLEYGLGWALGMLLIPILNGLTMNYRLYLICLLLLQLVMLIWLKFGIFESIRWLLSEGKINRAQIELQRACRINDVRNGAQLAQKIAQVQVQQVRKASSVLEQKLAPEWLAKVKQQDLEEAAKELSQLSAAIRRSFSVHSSQNCANLDHNSLASINASPEVGAKQLKKSLSQDHNQVNHNNPNNLNSPRHLSPTLVRKSFSCNQTDMMTTGSMKLPSNDPTNYQLATPFTNKGSNCSTIDSEQSITTQGLIQLALSYSKTLQRQEEGSWFIIRLFHRKLYKLSLILILLDTMLETIYFGLVETNKFVGSNVDENYIIGALFEFSACGVFMLIMWLFSRRKAIIFPTLISSLVCLAVAINYHLIPDIKNQSSSSVINSIETESELKLLIPNNLIVDYDQVGSSSSENLHLDLDMEPVVWRSIINKQEEHKQLIDLREGINFWLIAVGKLATAVSILVVTTIAMESYPNNLRQTGPATIMLVGRIGSILAPFLFNDPTDDKLFLQGTLITLSILGLLGCILVPLFMRPDTKDSDLFDHLNEIN